METMFVAIRIHTFIQFLLDKNRNFKHSCKILGEDIVVFDFHNLKIDIEVIEWNRHVGNKIA